MIKKSREEVLNILLQRLQANTSIVNVDPGSIARTFSEILSEEFYQFYKELDLITTMGFVSTAQGQFLDLIATLVNCTRNTGETDADFRNRIVNQVYVVAGANEISIRLKALSVTGVRDVVMRPFTKGTGSFTVYLITDNPVVSQSLINDVQDVIDQSRAFGVSGEVRAPVLLPVELKVRLIFNDKATDAEKGTIRQATKQSIKSYIDNLSLGSSFTISEIIKSSMNVSPRISSTDIYSLKVNGTTQLARSFDASWNERIVVRALEVI